MSEQERCPDCLRPRGPESSSHTIALPDYEPDAFCWAHVRNAEPCGYQHECELATITRLRSELAAKEARVAELEDMIRDSAPLAWAASGDLDDAQDWEKRATELLEKKP